MMSGVKRTGSDNEADSSSSSSRRKTDDSEEGSQGDCFLPFYLTRVVSGVAAEHNEYSLALQDVVSGDSDKIEAILLCSMQLDFAWLCRVCPQVLDDKIDVVILHGEKDGAQLPPDRRDGGARNKRVTFSDILRDHRTLIRQVHVDDGHGSFHSKFGIIFYKCGGCRVMVTTSNLTETDFCLRTNMIFVQDFPLKKRPGGQSDFERTLTDHVKAINMHHPRDEFGEFAPEATTFARAVIDRISRYNFNAEVVLIASVPGRHTGENLEKYGHLKLKRELRGLDGVPTSAPLVMQASSISSMLEGCAFLKELQRSMGALDATLQVPWMTAKAVSEGNRGNNTGDGMIARAEHVLSTDSSGALVVKKELKRALCVYDSGVSGRALSAPHCKSYLRYTLDKGRVELKWFLLTSSNISMAAWGVCERGGTQLYVKSFELGVLFLPRNIESNGRSYSCTPDHPLLGVTTVHYPRKFIVQRCPSVDREVLSFPVPYEVPPRKFNYEQEFPFVIDLQ